MFLMDLITSRLIGSLVLLLTVMSAHGVENYACDINLCDDDLDEFQCQSGSIILIEEVMCRRGGENCDKIAFHEVTRMCSGRQICHSVDMWYIRGQFCAPENNMFSAKQDLSVVFVSYVCISRQALERNCSRRGVAVSPEQSYISSPGYPALVIGSSVCTWRIHPPKGYDVDVLVREYLHVDQSDKLFVRVRELFKNRIGMKLEQTSDRGLKFTLKGDVEILMFTHGALGGHRVWIEYRFVRSSTLNHLRPFNMPNRTDCGGFIFNTTSTSITDESQVTSQVSSTNFISTEYSVIENSTFANGSTSTQMSGLTTISSLSKETNFNDTEIEPPSIGDLAGLGLNETAILQEQYEQASDLPIILASCIVGAVFTITLIVIVFKYRKRKKPCQSRNCLGMDTISLASDRALLSCTPTQGRCHFVINSATLQVPETSAGSGNNIMLNDDLDIKTEPNNPNGKGISIIDSHSYQPGLDFNPIDFSKYIINSQQTNNDRKCIEDGV